MSTNKIKILKLYKSLLNESRKIPSYNFRCYALRKITDSFKENKNITDSEQIERLIKRAESNLQLIKRQALIGEMYSSEKLIIENIPKIYQN